MPDADPVPGPAERLTSQVLTDWDSVAALASDWNRLLSETAADTVFLRWEWVESWLKVSGRRCRPLVIVVRDGAGRLRAVAPFYIAEFRLLKLLPYRVLRVVADWPTGAEYQDLLVSPQVEAAALKSIATALGGCKDRWDCIWMPKLCGWTGVLERIRNLARAGDWHIRERPMTFGAVELLDSLDAFEARLSANRRQQLRRRSRQVESRDGVRIARCTAASELPGYLQALFHLHQERWATRAQQGVFARKPEEAQFYEEFTPVAMKNGWLRLFALYEGNVPKAIQLGYVYNGTFLQIQEGFDPQYQAGVGNVLRRRVLEACIDEGVRVYDFMGEMSDHKSRWLATERSGADAFVAHRSLKNAILFLLRIWPTGGYLRFRPARPAPDGGQGASP